MSKTRSILISLLLTLVIWGTISWPLPVYTFSGIPASSENSGKHSIRTMIPGDHLQFLYHLWLARDSFFGPTKLFHNPYEFNVGSDEDSYRPSMRYYLPFSLMYSVASIGGNAFGWNGTGFISLWLTLIFTWLLVKRYTDDRSAAVFAAAISIILPYRYITLFGGSPTGLAMMWVPIACYGLDVMVRDRKLWGGALAGAAIFLSGWADPHVTFFTALLSPFWCVICYLSNRDKIIPTKEEVKKLVIAAIPFVIFAGFIMLQAKGTKADLADTKITDLQSRIHEISLFSPHLNGILSRNTHGMDRHVYLGFIMTAIIAAGMLAVAVKSAARKIHPTRVFLPALLLFTGITAIAVLSSGINNPGGTLWWLRLCKILPPYGMIRQPAKIFIILPVFLAVFTAISLPQLLSIKFLKGKTIYIYALLAVAMIIDYSTRINPELCRLDRKQEAYAAVAADAEKQDKAPHVLCLPLWPGDSHWTSINQYYVSLYRIRMINGYRPTRRQTYFDSVYMNLESFNAGGYSGKQLDELLKMGANYIVLHEDAFPEKVSPFSVAHTLLELLKHPRIKLLKQDGAVWSFKILDTPEGRYEDLPDWKQHFPSRLWQAENSEHRLSEIREEQAASGGKYIHLNKAGASATISTFSAPNVKGLCYMVRTRGADSYLANVMVNGKDLPMTIKASGGKEWEWHKVMIPALGSYQQIQLRIATTSRPFDLDLVILATEDWNISGFSKIEMPAPIFFHAGYTDLETDEVVLSPGREPEDVIFYGPKLPMPAGTYKITAKYSTDAKDGTVIGQMRPRYHAGDTKPADIIAGQPAELIYKHPTNLRLALDLKYIRNNVLRIKSITIEKIKNRE